MPTVPSEIEQLVAGRPLIARLATAVGTTRHAVPVPYHYETDTIQVTTVGGKSPERVA